MNKLLLALCALALIAVVSSFGIKLPTHNVFRPHFNRTTNATHNHTKLPTHNVFRPRFVRVRVNNTIYYRPRVNFTKVNGTRVLRTSFFKKIGKIGGKIIGGIQKVAGIAGQVSGTIGSAKSVIGAFSGRLEKSYIPFFNRTRVNGTRFNRTRLFPRFNVHKTNRTILKTSFFKKIEKVGGKIMGGVSKIAGIAGQVSGTIGSAKSVVGSFSGRLEKSFVGHFNRTRHFPRFNRTIFPPRFNFHKINRTIANRTILKTSFFKKIEKVGGKIMGGVSKVAGIAGQVSGTIGSAKSVVGSFSGRLERGIADKASKTIEKVNGNINKVKDTIDNIKQIKNTVKEIGDLFRKI